MKEGKRRRKYRKPDAGAGSYTHDEWDYRRRRYRKALLDARFKDTHPHCITIDDQAQACLPHMFGASNYTVLQEDV